MKARKHEGLRMFLLSLAFTGDPHNFTPLLRAALRIRENNTKDLHWHKENYTR